MQRPQLVAFLRCALEVDCFCLFSIDLNLKNKLVGSLILLNEKCQDIFCFN